MKRQKAVYLPDEICKDIEKRTKHIGFNFSDWVTQKYRKELLSEKNINKEIKEYKSKIKYLKKLKKSAKEKVETYKSSLNRSEMRFIKSVPRLLHEGYELKAIHRRFNHTFDRDETLNAFKSWVEYYGKKNK
ncbi:MAG: hypothetical protein ACOC5T_08470 [Elusimicrobiota bacterium]